MGPDIRVRIVDEYAWLRVPICIDVKIIPSPRDAAAYKLPVVLEIHGKQAFSGCHVPDLPDPRHHPHPLLHGGKQFHGSLISHRHIMEIQRIAAALFYKQVYEFITGHGLYVPGGIADGGSEDQAVLPEQFHGMHDLSVDAVPPAQVIDRFKALQADGQIQISGTFHFLAERRIHQRSVCIGQKRAVIVLFAEPDQIRLPYQRLSSSKHVEIDPQLLALSDHVVHFLEGKVQPVPVFRSPASGTVQVAGTGRIHQDQPGDIALMDSPHLSDRPCPVKKCFKAQVERRRPEHMGIRFRKDPPYIPVQCPFPVTDPLPGPFIVKLQLRAAHIFLHQVQKPLGILLPVLVPVLKRNVDRFTKCSPSCLVCHFTH